MGENRTTRDESRLEFRYTFDPSPEGGTNVEHMRLEPMDKNPRGASVPT
jgi:hypothetical protein